MVFPMIKGFVYFGNAFVFLSFKQMFSEKVDSCDANGGQKNKQKSVARCRGLVHLMFDVFGQMFYGIYKQGTASTNDY